MPPCNKRFLRPTRLYNPNCISIGLEFFAQLTGECRPACWGMSFPLKSCPFAWRSRPHFCTAHVRVSSGMSGHALPPQNCPFPWRIWTHLICVSLGPPNSASQTAPLDLLFLHSSLKTVPILYNWHAFPPKLPLSMGRSGAPFHT